MNFSVQMKLNQNSSENAFEFYLKVFKITDYVREFRFHESRRFRFDFAWIEKRISVEIDGGQWEKFGGRHNRDSDRDKLNLAASLGWRVLRFSTHQLNQNPKKCIEILLSCLK